MVIHTRGVDVESAVRYRAEDPMQLAVLQRAQNPLVKHTSCVVTSGAPIATPSALGVQQHSTQRMLSGKQCNFQTSKDIGFQDTPGKLQDSCQGHTLLRTL